MGVKRVHGKAEILFTVDLPEETASDKVVCDNLAVEAILEAIPQGIDVYLWGRGQDPASVFVEIHEEDVEIDDE